MFFLALPPNLACQTGVFNTSASIVAGISSTAGSASLNLNTPYDVFIDGIFNIFVADYANNRIQKFSSGLYDFIIDYETITIYCYLSFYNLGVLTGNTVAGLTLTAGSSYSQLSSPTSIFVDLNGAMYIADASNYRIQKWLPGQPLGVTVAGGAGNGAGLNQIGFVYSIFVDDQSNIYISDNTYHRVVLWLFSNITAGQLVSSFSFFLTYLF